ncbi:MAG: TIGR04282 family arsenosugar biosynthesis glycosyltransferase [Oscillatoriaceae bacterium SKW80]|nr:TIGR04282 family arsenosugar biosynthesis glycosyltransferase [Oscillatoriaceae bacterium SKYG93]MCX8120762.1 TIGR04282 family arsenosugar biosynthesis glycosyltransferase [Oscillatoriaceae bacterium SKW80]MDW8452127.1 TIGR04282 family arsenosugar biosynthesis glycosyltransferase [Oscillatoriaceae cyanobacterium SKYGB_i_bin93]
MSGVESDRLIVFARYPEAGKTKTRLIPALGATGAAELYRKMAEKTLAVAKNLAKTRCSCGAATPSLTIEVWYTGGNLELMREWLGDGIIYQPQTEGDLGERMANAFSSAFRTSKQAILIGTDCPGLDTAGISEAFEQLQQHELILGPAVDGGYYLIGLKRIIPELFQGICWGTSKVLQQTLAIAHQLNLSYSLLPELADIDHPEDLAILDLHF